MPLFPCGGLPLLSLQALGWGLLTLRLQGRSDLPSSQEVVGAGVSMCPAPPHPPNAPVRCSLRSLLDHQAREAQFHLGSRSRWDAAETSWWPLAVGKEKWMPQAGSRGTGHGNHLRAWICPCPNWPLPLNFPIACANIFVDYLPLFTQVGLDSALSNSRACLMQQLYEKVSPSGDSEGRSC